LDTSAQCRRLAIGSSDRGSWRLRLAKEGVDDWDKPASFVVDATARRSTLSLGDAGIIGRGDHIGDWKFRLQKFGLDALESEKKNALELEIAKEKSTSLGIAGKKLRDSIVKYRQSTSYNDVASQERDRPLTTGSSDQDAASSTGKGETR
jgi:hypothetical protein